jgi:AraC-like DNA-binding protein
MNITKHQVHPALKEFVETIFCFNRGAHENGDFSQTALPSHECFLSFEYDTDFLIKKNESENFVRSHLTTIIPPQLLKTEIKGKTIKAIMIKFKNGGFFRLFKIPIPHFKNECYNARDVFDKDFTELYEQIMEVDELETKIKVVELFLLKKVKQARPFMPVDFVAEKLSLNNGNVPILDLASCACMSVRQLQRKFMEQFGLSPKHYSKFIRFTNAYQMRTLFPHLTWGEISMRCGYFDQMHLIHDFQSIASLNPCELDMNISKSNILLVPANQPIK